MCGDDTSSAEKKCSGIVLQLVAVDVENNPLGRTNSSWLS